ncbi:MAG: type II secretion system protein [Okeania sp. SIO3C4]|nr:type II secretion system protein [Okeania sp. SIO3C4]
MFRNKYKQNISKIDYSSDSGYTIMESLVAMIVVAVLMSAIAPVIALSVGTRVQARRLELAALAARSYISWIESPRETDERNNRSPKFVTESFNSGVDAPDTTAGVDCTGKDQKYCDTNRTLFCIDGDDTGGCELDSPTDFIVQGTSFSDKGALFDTGSDVPNYDRGYQLLVRVYRADAFQEDDLCPQGTDSDCPAGTRQSVVTNAIGNRRLPMTEIITDIPPLQSSFQNLCNRLGGC